MLSSILWLPFIGFFGGSFCGRHMGRGIVFFTTVHVLVTFCVGFFLLCTNFTQNKISTLIISPWIICDALEVNWELYCLAACGRHCQIFLNKMYHSKFFLFITNL